MSSSIVDRQDNFFFSGFSESLRTYYAVVVSKIKRSLLSLLGLGLGLIDCDWFTRWCKKSITIVVEPASR